MHAIDLTECADWADANAQATAQQCPLYVPSGTHSVPDLGVITAPIVLGDGPNRSILQQPSNAITTIWGRIGSHVTIRDLGFNALPSLGQHHQLTTDDNAEHIRLERIGVSGFPQGYGLYLGRNAQWIWLTDSDIEAYYWGLTLTNPRHVRVRGCRLTTTGPNGVLEIEPDAGQTCDDLDISHCLLDGQGTAGHGVNAFSPGAFTGTVRIAHNTIRNCTTGVHHRAVQRLQVQGNAFESISGLLYSHHYEDPNLTGLVSWQGNTRDGEPSMLEGVVQLMNGTFAAMTGWNPFGAVTHDTATGLTGGGWAQNGRAARLTPTNNLAYIESSTASMCSVRAGLLVDVTATFRHVSVPTQGTPLLKVWFYNAAGQDVTPGLVRPVKLSAPDGTYDTTWRQATLLVQVPAAARKARVLAGFFSAGTGDVLIDQVQVRGGV